MGAHATGAASSASSAPFMVITWSLGEPLGLRSKCGTSGSPTSSVWRCASRARGGLTLDDIGSEFEVSRRTAERMRDAVEHAFGPLEYEETDDGRRRWKLRSNALRDLIRVSADELVELETAAAEVERAGLHERRRPAAEPRREAARTRGRGGTAPHRAGTWKRSRWPRGLRCGPDRAPRIEPGLLMTLREAIKAGRTVSFRYLSRMTGRRSRQRVQPHGILYGSRAYLVGRSDWTEEMRYWVLANMSEAALADESFEFEEGFDLEEFAGRSFGVFQEEPIDVVLRFAPEVAADAATFLFHPRQTMENEDDGSLIVRFTAGGTREMCWHLFTWGDAVTAVEPESLRAQMAELCSRFAVHHQDRPAPAEDRA